MNDLFAPPANPDAIYSDKLRVRKVDGDGMEPDLRGRDYVLFAPVGEYVGEGIYLILIGGGEALYRVQSILGGKLLMKLDNPIYRDSGHICTRQEFAEIALGFVVADIKVRDSRFLSDAAGVGL
jgi:hypothetical protein